MTEDKDVTAQDIINKFNDIFHYNNKTYINTIEVEEHPPVITKRYTDLIALILDMRESALNVNNIIIVADDPMSLLRGWVCDEANMVWEIHNNDYINSLKTIPLFIEQNFEKHRSNIAKWIKMHNEEIEKYSKLKAFW